MLFLCTGNYYRSRFAELFFNHLAESQRLSWRATSRGLRLTDRNVGPIAACAHEALAARGAPAASSSRFPLAVVDQDFALADLVIAVKRAEHEPMVQSAFPSWAAKVRYWEIHDVDAAPVHEAIPALDSAVQNLIKELSMATR